MSDHSSADATGILISRFLAAPPHRVFAAWTNPADFAVWFGGAGADVPPETVTMDVRPGGSWRATMFAGPERSEIPWSGAYLEVDVPGRLVFTLADRPGDEHERVTVDLDDFEGGTQLEFRQEGGHLDAEGYERARAGWLAFFDAMDDVVAQR